MDMADLCGLSDEILLAVANWQSSWLRLPRLKVVKLSIFDYYVGTAQASIINPSVTSSAAVSTTLTRLVIRTELKALCSNGII
jgi:hypothetical protein